MKLKNIFFYNVLIFPEDLLAIEFLACLHSDRGAFVRMNEVSIDHTKYSLDHMAVWVCGHSVVGMLFSIASCR